MGAVCGLFEQDLGGETRTLLEKMLGAMSHRGRGESRFFCNQNISLAWKSTLPKLNYGEGYSQPSSDHPYCAFDGILFDWKDLSETRDVHERNVLGIDFGRIVADLYSSKGISFLETLDGVFSLAIWDPSQRRLVLARDRFGSRPLYYSEGNGKILFASEMKGIYSVLDPKPSPNLSVLSEYLIFRCVLGPNTFFEGIKEVPAGHCLLIRNGDISEKKYWHLEKWVRSGEVRKYAFYERGLEELLKKAVTKRAKLSKRIGANCSGGIDSGLVIAFANSGIDSVVESFTVGFDEKAWDERFYAGLTAHKYGTCHNEIIVSSERFVEPLEFLNWQNDEPLSDPNSVLLYLLAKFSQEKIDVLLTGEGADEALLGYPRYNMLNLYSIIRSFPKAIGATVSWYCSVSSKRRLQKLNFTLKLDPLDAVIYNSSFVARNLVKKILNEEFWNFRFQERQRILQENGEKRNLLSDVIIYDIKSYTSNSLKRLDKMSMAVGLEVVNPFLDKALFEYVLHVPRKYKINLFNNKIILRNIARRYLPRENMRMPKSGFGVPIGEWFVREREFDKYFREIFYNESMRGIFNLKELKMFYDLHRKGGSDYSEILWLVLNFYLWHEAFFRS